VVDPRADEAALIGQIAELERLKSAAAAGQARAAARLDELRRTDEAATGVPARQRGRGVASVVALARRDSPARGGRHLGFAKALVHEMPHTLAALAEGRLSEWRATLLVRETACLSREDRARVDAELVADQAMLAGLGDRRVAAEARRLAYRLDPSAALAKARKAEGDRRVTCRPAPDTMAYSTALLPVRDAVAVQAALIREADNARADGEARSRGQLMADIYVQRLTGRTTATGPDISLHVVMTDQALLGAGPGADEPAQVPGHGPVPASTARRWLRQEPPVPAVTSGADADPEVVTEAAVWVRRLYAHPSTGELVAMDSQARFFRGALRRFLVVRDDVCRTPWCDAIIRHADHVVPVAEGGRTSAENGNGLCEQCNYAKDSPGWSAQPRVGHAAAPDSGHQVETVTPTGHRYVSRPPPLPGTAPRGQDASGTKSGTAAA
jgi:Domain of unknown function (DUF222)/HNH endonuclease